MGVTNLANLIDPEVMADSISAELPNKLKSRGFMKVETTLSAKPGDTITIPRFNYVGPAADLAEGEEGNIDTLTTNEASYTVKKAVKNIELTDEAALSGYGDPVSETNKQLRMAIQDKIDDDAMDLLESDAGMFRVDVTDSALSFEVVSDAMLQFASEEEGELTYLLVSQEGLKQIRNDSHWFDTVDIGADMLKNGVVGKFAGAFVVISNKLNGTNDERSAYLLKPGALTAFIKRDVNLETGRNVLAKKTLFSVDEHYVVAIEDDNKIVGIDHLNEDVGRMRITFATKKQSDGTYDSDIISVNPDVFDGNQLFYKLGGAPIKAATISGTTTSGWTEVAEFPVSVEDVASTPIISMAQTVSGTMTPIWYYGTCNLLK